jgi:hypothetical protein
LAAELMTRTLSLVRNWQSPDEVASRAETSAISKGAERACELFFARIAPAGPVGPDERRAMAQSVVDIISVNGDRLIPARARPSTHLHLLLEGWAYRAHMLPDGARQITDIFVPGDFCRWAAPASWDTGQDIRACGRARFAVLRKDGAGPERAALRRSWEWVRDAETRILHSRLVSLGRRDAHARVAHFISELHERLQRVGLVNGGVFTCPLTQEQLADVLGLTAVHINRVLQKLRAERLVLINRPHIYIPDLARLHEAAGFNEGPD